jgi:hypothetical protein
MKKILFLMTIAAVAIAFAGCSKDDDDDSNKTPPYAASTQTYKFGSQIWSDAIHDPACNKADFDGGSSEAPKADGCSYTDDGRTYYYYSWPYVVEHAIRLCPSPWRVPTLEDFETLANNTNGNALSTLWGYGGYPRNSSMYNVSSDAYYWSSTEVGNYMYYLNANNSGLYMFSNGYKYTGSQIRCVK